MSCGLQRRASDSFIYAKTVLGEKGQILGDF